MPKILKRVPDKYKLQYLRSYKKLIEIRKQLEGFYPRTQEECIWTKNILKEYKKHFTTIANINKYLKSK
jgi:hypothetical protein